MTLDQTARLIVALGDQGSGVCKGPVILMTVS